ncbi:MAG: tRNA 2-thiouridine(34) synthase MnmA [Candidatus Omnitrophota bacterium]
MKIIAAMSGGADSSVAALQLKDKGYDVIGLTIKTWPDSLEKTSVADEINPCCSAEAISKARRVAQKLNIPHYVVDLSEKFKKNVKKYFALEYASGRTPNPCICCNSKIKFGYLFDEAKKLGAEKIATGHYSRIIHVRAGYFLAEAKDRKRDQSYFLCGILKKRLKNIEFPLGETKGIDVRRIALEKGFVSREQKSSQDICFTSGDGGYRKYLKDFGVDAFIAGSILDVNGKKIGEHKGIASYTIGQRRGMGIASTEPLYVIDISREGNTITVGSKSSAMRKKVMVKNINWLIADVPDDDMLLEVKIRYNSKKVWANVRFIKNDGAFVEFKDPQFAPCPGQAAVFYKGEIVWGGGWIN